MATTGLPVAAPADDFNQAHYVGGTEEVKADHARGPLRRRRDLVDVQRRCICGQDAIWFCHAVEFGKDLLLDFHVLEDRFDDQVGVFHPAVTGSGLDHPESLVHGVRAHPSAVDTTLEVLADGCHPPFEGLGGVVAKPYRDSGVDQRHRNAAAHGSGTDDRGRLDIDCRGDFLHVGNFGNRAFGEEPVNHRPGLVRGKALCDELLFMLPAFVERQRRGCFQGGQGKQGSGLVLSHLSGHCMSGGESVPVGFGRAQLVGSFGGLGK